MAVFAKHKNIKKISLGNILIIPIFLIVVLYAVDTLLSQTKDNTPDDNNVPYKDVPIEIIEDFLEGKKMLAFRSDPDNPLTEDDLRYVYAFLKVI